MSETARNTWSRWGCALLVAIVALLLVTAVVRVYPERRYNLASHRINRKICDLQSRRPEGVSPELWDFKVTWASIAFCNICFSEGHAPYEEMCRLERELDVRLQAPIDLQFFDWLWERLAQTGPHGRRYVERWQAELQSIEGSQ